MKDAFAKKIKKYHELNRGIVSKPNLTKGTKLKLAASIPLVLIASSTLHAQSCEDDIANTQIIPNSGGMGVGFDFDVNGAGGTGDDFRIFEEFETVSHAVKIKILNSDFEILVNAGSTIGSAFAERHTNTTAATSFTMGDFAGTAQQPLWLNSGINGQLGEWNDNGTPSEGYIIFRDKNTGNLGFFHLIYDFVNPNKTVTILRGGLDGDGGSIIPGDCGTLDPPLSVELLEFKAVEKEGQAQLDWMTDSETENAGFEVQRSEDSENFKTIAFVEGNGTTTGASYYSLMDKEVRQGMVYYYRLKQIDFNGLFDYSDVIPLRISSETAVIGEVYPNPADNKTFHIDVETLENGEWDISLFDHTGLLISKEQRYMPAGLSTQTFIFDYLLLDGMYVLKLENGQNRVYRKVAVANADR